MKRILIILAITSILLFPLVVWAQPALPGAPAQTPIDGGMLAVAAAAGAWAVNKLRKDKK